MDGNYSHVSFSDDIQTSYHYVVYEKVLDHSGRNVYYNLMKKVKANV